MKAAGVLFFALMLGACSRSENDRAREQAHQAADQLRQDSRKALHEAQKDASVASHELNRDLDKTREKVRQALNEHPDRGDNDENGNNRQR